MDFRKLATGAATFLNRAVQVTEERFGHAEKTEFDAHVEQLLQKVDTTQRSTEKIIKQVDCLLQPNPAYRVEGAVMHTLDRRRPDRLTALEELGLILIDAGLDYGSETTLGNILLKCGQTEQKCGQEEKEFGHGTNESYLMPLRTFLDNEMKNLQRERRQLETRRIDLDVCRSRLRRARSDNARQQAEEDVRGAQRDFDQQLGVVRHLSESALSQHTYLRKYLVDFVEHQMLFYAKCHQHLTELSRQLSSAPSCRAEDAGTSEGRRARALYKYDAGDASELSLEADEVITVFCSNASSVETETWLMAQKERAKGKVPSAYVELLD